MQPLNFLLVWGLPVKVWLGGLETSSQPGRTEVPGE